ncbi:MULTISPECIES: NotI family restriction endonuclease [unclassified Serratia (in: enterobacteria)]|uniref:NotI family restriction endonuclease n=1 Tax=unclassified Serratia (in: enterobacteria) TaxID=2647522 RepID=UPI000507D23B|nr:MULTISPECIES: NotI family restriction endonuclease [unclassified Serratia (in: enterobacteria)]KFK93371.1 EagI restriction endonuclease [Serratia sp. Ag2]KFK98372.1 EagI restriction endonuclease [Serratia sp. Ag1]
MFVRPKRDLIEVFGYAPDDLSVEARSLWRLGACPFTSNPCVKGNHDQTIIYGTCSVTSPYGDCIICPNRLYEDNYLSLKRVAADAFNEKIPFMTYSEYVASRVNTNESIVALGLSSGKEVKVKNLSMDWILAHIIDGELISYVGVEVQSIDITGNYRDSWHSYKNLTSDTTLVSSSEHGLNWANVHKRLIPQIIRKGLIYSKSSLVSSGLYFIVPDIVYKKFEDVIGKDIPLVNDKASNHLTVHTYSLSPRTTSGKQRVIIPERNIRFSLEEFSKRFISGVNLPSGNDLDNAVKRVLGII